MRATKKVVLNSAEIEISSAQLAGGESESNTTLLLIDMSMAREPVGECTCEGVWLELMDAVGLREPFFSYC